MMGSLMTTLAAFNAASTESASVTLYLVSISRTGSPHVRLFSISWSVSIRTRDCSGFADFGRGNRAVGALDGPGSRPLPGVRPEPPQGAFRSPVALSADVDPARPGPETEAVWLGWGTTGSGPGAGFGLEWVGVRCGVSVLLLCSGVCLFHPRMSEEMVRRLRLGTLILEVEPTPVPRASGRSRSHGRCRSG